MEKTQTKLGGALLKSLVDLHETNGQVKLEDVGAMFERMAAELHHEEAPMYGFLKSEITKLGSYITEAKKEILNISPLGDPGNAESSDLNIAGLELSEVVRATEVAANTIMDATDEVLAGVKELESSAASARISAAANRIYDACTFQDITGQRINKVAKTLEQVELKVSRLIGLFNDSNQHLRMSGQRDEEDRHLKDQRADAHLMNGPALSGEAPSQEDIDKLFGSL